MPLCGEGRRLKLKWYRASQKMEPVMVSNNGIAGMKLAPEVQRQIQFERRHSANYQYHHALYINHLRSCEICGKGPEL
jgi:hypothetical protein